MMRRQARRSSVASVRTRPTGSRVDLWAVAEARLSAIMTGPITEPVSVLMPVCNEVAVIESVVREWEADVFRHLPAGSELVFDDGDSRDGTLETLARLQGEV